MRSTFFFAALLLIAALAALLVERHRGAPTATATRGTATLVGDSLNVGIEPYLPPALPRWKIVANDRIGRSTAEGISELEAGRPPLSPYVVVSLGTNDAPTEIGAFGAEVAHMLRLIGPSRCVIWATIWRDGAPNGGFNAVLRDAAESNHRLRLVEWAAMVQQHADWLADDGLHGNETGYRERARAVAAATRSCAPAVNLTAQ